jgi:hypothetical protein
VEFSRILWNSREFSGIIEQISGVLRNSQEFSGIFRTSEEFSGILKF